MWKKVGDTQQGDTEALFLTSLGVLAQRQFAVEQILRDAVIFYSDIMTDPTKQLLHQDGTDTEKRCLSENYGVKGVFLLCDAENLLQTIQSHLKIPKYHSNSLKKTEKCISRIKL